jgi:small subunit ribosomal protein S4
MVKRAYPPGQKGKRRKTPLSEFGKELSEKQKLKIWYNLGERQFRKYVKEILQGRAKVEDAASLLIGKLERRLDNVVFRLGFCSSRAQARQLISHGHFLVNGRVVNIPSFQVKKGDKIRVFPKSSKRTIFQNLPTLLKKYKTPSWLELNGEKLEGKIVGSPSLQESAPPVQVSLIFEYYSK